MINVLDIGIAATGVIAILSILRKKMELKVTFPLILIFLFFIILKLTMSK